VESQYNREVWHCLKLLEEKGWLGEVHPFDLHCVRLSLDLCELRLGNNPNMTPPWKLPSGQKIMGFPSLKANVLDFSLETDQDVNFGSHFLHTGCRNFYLFVYPQIAKEKNFDCNDANQMLTMANLFTDEFAKELSSLSQDQTRSTNPYLRELLFLQQEYLKELRKRLGSTGGENTQAFPRGVIAARAYHVAKSIKQNRAAILNPIPDHPPGLFTMNWWLEEMEGFTPATTSQKSILPLDWGRPRS
jgi:hypothetical protein